MSVPPSQRSTREGHAGRGGGLADDVLGLALGADEEDVAAVGDGVLDEGAGLLEGLVGLGEVDDRDALAVVEDERLRTGIPALGLVPEVDACVEQVLWSDANAHCDLCICPVHRPAKKGRLAIVGWD